MQDHGIQSHASWRECIEGRTQAAMESPKPYPAAALPSLHSRRRTSRHDEKWRPGKAPQKWRAMSTHNLNWAATGTRMGPARPWTGEAQPAVGTARCPPGGGFGRWPRLVTSRCVVCNQRSCMNHATSCPQPTKKHGAAGFRRPSARQGCLGSHPARISKSHPVLGHARSLWGQNRQMTGLQDGLSIFSSLLNLYSKLHVSVQWRRGRLLGWYHSRPARPLRGRGFLAAPAAVSTRVPRI